MNRLFISISLALLLGLGVLFVFSGLGRDPGPVASRLSAESAEDRIEAANALAEAVGDTDPREAATVLWDRLQADSDLRVRGALCQALGRLRYQSPDAVNDAEQKIVATLADVERSPVANARDGREFRLAAARSLESLARLHAKSTPLSQPTIDALGRLAPLDALPAGDPDAETVTRVRIAAHAALVMAGALDDRAVDRALSDASPQVRRLGAFGLVRSGVFEGPSVERALGDPAPMVRLELLRGLVTASPINCQRVISATRDADPHVRLQAIDVLPRSCADGGTDAQAAGEVAEQLLLSPTSSWHPRAHAVVALAALGDSRAVARVASAASDPVWQVRMYAARAAGTLKDTGLLLRLAADDHDNVREAAITSLAMIGVPEAEGAYIAALSHSDYQLVRTAARALEKSQHSRRAVRALFAALERITAEQKETSRDTRRALLERLRELGSVEHAPALQPYLRDFDPMVAADVAAIVREWTTQPADPMPTLLSDTLAPSAGELNRYARSHIVISMRALGDIRLRLFPYEAPTNVARFVRLSQAGYFNGLTWHRVVPNFVIQGGSPGANEYAGDGPFTRDELGLRSHTRGTVGISTRGRDTGDGQLFINLVDNLRLDHNYTIVADVVSGMDVVDRILEGAVIDRVSVIDAESR